MSLNEDERTTLVGLQLEKALKNMAQADAPAHELLEAVSLYLKK